MALANSESKQTVNPFLRSWAWKREHRYRHARGFDEKRVSGFFLDEFFLLGQIGIVFIGHTSTQFLWMDVNERFPFLRFASTVWDSAIVLSKYLERWPFLVDGKQCIELGAGCGLPGITAACLGATNVLLTDLSVNLPLLKENVLKHNLANKVSVAKLEWGQQADLRNIKTHDVILAADIMYDASVIAALLTTIRCLASASTHIFLAYGRNRQAEQTFVEQTKHWFLVEKIEMEKLDNIYQCVDVDVFVMQKKQDV